MAKKKAKSKLTYVLDDGSRYSVIGEDGVYFYVEAEDGRKTQFRKAAQRGTVVREAIEQTEEPPKDEDGGEKEE